MPSDRPRDLPDLLGRLARYARDEVGVIDAGVGTVTWGELWRCTRVLARRLRAAGVGPGDCVAVWLPNWSAALCWQFAAAARGAHVIGVNTRYNVDEIAHVLATARPKLVAVAHDFHGLDPRERLRRAVAVAGTVPVVAVVAGPGRRPVGMADLAGYDVGAGAWAAGADGTADGGVGGTADGGAGGTADGGVGGSDGRLDGDTVAVGLDGGGAPDGGLAADAAPDDAATPSDPARFAVAFTTSGSTGKPKLAAHTGAAVVRHALADAAVIGLTSGDVLLCAIPLAGTYGFSGAMAALAGGATVLLEPVFDADAVLERMVRHRVSHVTAGDDLVLRLRQAADTRRPDLGSWRWWGAAEFQGRLRELAEWAGESFGTATTGLYGSSEIFALAAMWRDDVPAPGRWCAGGRVVDPAIEVRVADPATGADLPPGEEGELLFRGPNVVDGYLGEHRDPGATAAAFTQDGWFRSGDLGFLVEPGVFRYTCRMGDALRLRGFLVDPAEIESRLAEHPGVDTAKVVGVPGPGGDTRAVGFVVGVPDADADPERLRGWCAATLAKFKVPDVVYVIDEMPTTSGTNGTKIRAAQLREWAREWGAPPG